MKFIRNYQLIIQRPPIVNPAYVYGDSGISYKLGGNTNRDLIIIEPNFTMNAEIERSTTGSPNQANITIINLAENTRNQLYKDRYNTLEKWLIEIKAGYEDLKTIFIGYARQIQSYKQGTEWYTEIDAYDGLFDLQNSFVSQTVSKNTPIQDMVKNVVNTMENTTLGAMGTPVQDQGSSRGQVLFGWSKDVMKLLSNGQYFIDNNILHCLANGEVIGDQVIVLDSEQLLTTPKRRDTFLDVETLFLPEAQLGITFQLKSKEKMFNGQYACLGIKHSFRWSGADCGDSRTNLSLYYGAEGLKKVG